MTGTVYTIYMTTSNITTCTLKTTPENQSYPRVLRYMRTGREFKETTYPDATEGKMFRRSNLIAKVKNTVQIPVQSEARIWRPMNTLCMSRHCPCGCAFTGPPNQIASDKAARLPIMLLTVTPSSKILLIFFHSLQTRRITYAFSLAPMCLVGESCTFWISSPN